MKNLLVVPAAFLVWMVGCSGEPVRYSTGLDSTKALGALDDDEWSRTCTGAHEFIASQVQLTDDELCRFSALFSLSLRIFQPAFASDEQARAECRTVYDQ